MKLFFIKLEFDLFVKICLLAFLYYEINANANEIMIIFMNLMLLLDLKNLNSYPLSKSSSSLLKYKVNPFMRNRLGNLN